MLARGPHSEDSAGGSFLSLVIRHNSYVWVEGKLVVIGSATRRFSCGGRDCHEVVFVLVKLLVYTIDFVASIVMNPTSLALHSM